MSLGKSIAKKINSDLKEKVAIISDGKFDTGTDVKIWIPTGATELDFVIKNGPGGGLPVSKIVTMAGHEATGKSLFAIQCMANAQRMGGFCVYIDQEQSLNLDFAQRVGLDLDNNFMHIDKIISCEKVFKIIQDICSAIAGENAAAKKEKRDPEYSFALVVWDTIAATPTEHDLKEENIDPTTSIALKPRILSNNMNILLKNAQREHICFLFLNQLRTRIGAMPGQDPYVEPGGKSVPYAASIRLRISSVGKMRGKDKEIYGINTRVKVIKNRFGPPHRTAEFPIYFSYGFDDEESIVNVLKKHGKVFSRKGGRSGTLFSFHEVPKGNPDNLPEWNAVEFKSLVRTDPEIRKKVLQLMEECLVKDMVDPRSLSLEVVNEND